MMGLTYLKTTSLKKICAAGYQSLGNSFQILDPDWDRYQQDSEYHCRSQVLGALRSEVTPQLTSKPIGVWPCFHPSHAPEVAVP